MLFGFNVSELFRAKNCVCGLSYTIFSFNLGMAD